MPFRGTYRRFRFLNKTSILIALAIATSALLILSQFTRSAYGNALGLESLPNPYVSASRLMNCSAVVASSSPLGHGPCGAAHTMDVMGVIMVSAQFGLKTDNGTLEATMDDTISWYNFTSAQVTLNDLTSNLVVVGGPGVNQVTWYYNNLRYPNGTKMLPAYFDKFPNGTDYIYVVSTAHSYSIQLDGLGRVKDDYGLILTLDDHGRHVLILAGLGGSGTWASCKIVSSYESWSLHGGAAVVRYSDTNSDGFLDALSIVEFVSSTINLSNILGPLAFELFAAAMLPKLNVMKKKIFRRRRLLEACIILIFAAAAQISMIVFSDDPDSGFFTFKDLSHPFVAAGGLLNCSAVVASSSPGGHGPCGAAHTMDVMGGIMVAAQFGVDATGGSLASTLDDYISTYDLDDGHMTFSPLTCNILVEGGPGVNQVTWYYNNLRYPNGTKMLPAYFDKFVNGTDYIYVVSTAHRYKITLDGQGRVKDDYGLILTLDDHGRHVLILAGLGGSGTWASCKIISSYESWSLHGGAAVVKYSDTNSDGFLDTLSIVEFVSSTINLSNILGPLAFQLLAAAMIPKTKVIKKKIFRKRRLLEACVVLIFAAGAQISMTVFSGDPDSGFFTLKDLSHPFVAAGGLLNCSAVVASSSPEGHGPCGPAHTMDVMGGIMVAAQFGIDATGGSLGSTVDDYISTYDFGNGHITFSPLTCNILVEGGPGVNQITWYYNNLRNGSGERVLPVYFDKFPNGTDYIYVPSNGHQYVIEFDGLGRVSADYGVATLYYDSDHEWWVVIAAGLGGPGTGAASRLLATYRNWSIFGGAVIVKYYDSNGDGYLDSMSVPEVVGVGKSIDLYWDPSCMNIVQSIDWGTLVAGEIKNVTVYVRNEGASNTVLALSISGWNPLQAQSYLDIDWNYSGTPVTPGQTLPITLMLNVNYDISGITDFGVNVTVSSG